MKKKLLTLLSLLCVAVTTIVGFVACDKSGDDGSSTPAFSEVDYAGQVHLDETAETLTMQVSVKAFIDGDTTHFNVPSSFTEELDEGYLKARYLGVNTPESTGKIEEYGKKASNFTKEKLKNATSIILETDGSKWEVDSTGNRYLVWVWYLPAGETEYRNLNIELLQNGLAVGSKAGENRYGETCTNAIYQATKLKLNVFSGQPDPDFYYGSAIELDLKELRTNVEAYDGLKVAFNAYVSNYYNNGVFVESYDEATDRFYGIYIYYGTFLNQYGKLVLKTGNYVRIVGTVQFWETGGTWQVADPRYDRFDLNNPENIQLLDKATMPHAEKYPASSAETSVTQYKGSVSMEVTNVGEDGEETITNKTFAYANLAMHTSISMKNLTVNSISTTDNGGKSDGSMTLSCTVNGISVNVRTVVLKDADGNLVTEEDLQGKTIDVSGIVDYFMNDYQIKVLHYEAINIHE